MTLTPTVDIIAEARSAGTGVGAFNVIQLEHAEAIVAGAEQAARPVILQISENCVRYHGALEPIATATIAVARAARVPVSVHLDHVEQIDLVNRAIGLGLSSIMFDASTLPLEDNLALTAEISRRCRFAGLSVEGEIGEIGGKDGAHAPGVRTDPKEAQMFAAETGVDLLAVAVGSSHAMTSRTASLDLDLITTLRDAVDVPLVLHGSSGVDDEGLRAAVAAGMTKVNIATQLNKVFTAAVRDRLDADPALVDTRKYLGPARDAVSAEVARLLRLLDIASDGDGPRAID